MKPFHFLSVLFAPCPMPFVAAAVLGLTMPMQIRAAGAGKTFSSPEDAARALGAAANSGDMNAIADIFGPGFQDLKSPDPVKAKQELEQFVQRFNASNHVEHVTDNQCTLEIGEDRWPFAIPILRTNKALSTEAATRKHEIAPKAMGKREPRP